MRVPATQFFSSRSNGLVGSEIDLVLDCYRLAHFYHQPPDLFLDMPLGDVRLHLDRTVRLANLMRQSEDAD